MIGQPRQGSLFYRLMVLFVCFGLLLVHHFEQRGNPAFGGVHMKHGRLQSRGNMEGMEVRFGIGRSTLTAVVTSNTASGSYNSMHDSYSLLGGMVLLVNMLRGELIFWRAGQRSLQHGRGNCDCSRLGGTHGWTNPGISGQEDRAARKQNDRALRLGRASLYSPAHGNCRKHQGSIVGTYCEQGAPRLYRNSVWLHVLLRQ